VWIMADSTGALFGGYYHGTTFGELENGISIGRYITSDGRELFVPQKNLTLGTENSGPLVGPIIISEIMYHSQDNASDFIEITNITDQEIPLYHPSYPNFTWKISGVNFSFPSGISIKPGESIVIASDSIPESSFRARYNIPSEVKIFQMVGGLKNSTETISILKPEDPYVDTKVSPDTLYPYMTFDFVTYSDQKPWPSEADGGGMSLHRVSKEVFGDDPVNWKAASPTPGKFQ
ncbi:MAG: lamin tail domain-containing protein, partial [Chitinispirillaceae bacterium]|nr:lamin tail domain-containing protein [Chitinispirillaceae bacterium]